MSQQFDVPSGKQLQGTLNALLKVAGTPNGPNVVESSGVTDDGTTLSYKGTPIAGGGSGGITGSLTPGRYPVASAAHAVADGQIDFGVTTANTVAVVAPNFLVETDSSAPGFGIALVDGSGVGLTLETSSGGPITMNAGGGGAHISIATPGSGGGAISIAADGALTLSAAGGDVHINPNANNCVIDGPIVPGVVYSVAGTPLPVAPPLGSRAVVSDATAPTFLGAYVGGGAVVAPVLWNGTIWVTA
jgi:hypothetical protein